MGAELLLGRSRLAPVSCSPCLSAGRRCVVLLLPWQRLKFWLLPAAAHIPSLPDRSAAPRFASPFSPSRHISRAALSSPPSSILHPTHTSPFNPLYSIPSSLPPSLLALPSFILRRRLIASGRELPSPPSNYECCRLRKRPRVRRCVGFRRRTHQAAIKLTVVGDTDDNRGYDRDGSRSPRIDNNGHDSRARSASPGGRDRTDSG